jgi:hypothetical protein
MPQRGVRQRRVTKVRPVTSDGKPRVHAKAKYDTSRARDMKETAQTRPRAAPAVPMANQRSERAYERRAGASNEGTAKWPSKVSLSTSAKQC